MTYFGEDEEKLEAETGGGRGSRVVTWIVVGALALILVNIGIAAVGGKKKTSSTPTPTPIVTARPTAPAPSLPSFESTPEPIVVPSQVAPALPLPSPRLGPPAYPTALGALTVGGDIVLVDSVNGKQLTTLVTHQPGSPVKDISWDAPRGIMYFDRGGPCPTVWRYRFEFGLPELFANGAHPVVSPDGTQVAVIGTGCGPGGAKSDGVAFYAAATGAPQMWIPSPSSAPSPAGRLRVADVDWRPDGASLAVTLNGIGRYVYKLLSPSLNSRPPPADLGAAPDIPLLYEFREQFYQLEYVGQRLLLVGHCCFGESKEPSERLAIRNPSDATLTSLVDTSITSVTADRRGEVRYLAAEPDGQGRLHLITLPESGSGKAALNERILGGGLFLRIDW
ncbi:MAG: hypothetical protein ABI912_04485 [Actinomycetota bacterium]